MGGEWFVGTVRLPSRVYRSWGDDVDMPADLVESVLAGGMMWLCQITSFSVLYSWYRGSGKFRQP